MIITRKIEIYITGDSKKELYRMWYDWNKIVHKAANTIVTHAYLQDQIKELCYLTEEIKIKLANIEKDIDGIFNTSAENTTYRVLSKEWKGDIPTEILTCLNSQIRSKYAKDKTDIYIGKRSIVNYRNNIPMPFKANSIFRNIEEVEGKKDYDFVLFKTPFRTRFGADRSNNRIIIERILKGEYKACISSIKIDSNKMFLLLCVDIPKIEFAFDSDIKMICNLSMEHPVTWVLNKSDYINKIGSKEDYLYKRLGIQRKLRELQIACKQNKGGHGRKQKLQALDRFHLKEKNYIDTKLHQYSSEIIMQAIKNKCAVIELQDIDEKIKNAKENDYVLRNWSYYGFIEKIKYKAKKYGIEVMLQSS